MSFNVEQSVIQPTLKKVVHMDFGVDKCIVFNDRFDIQSLLLESFVALFLILNAFTMPPGQRIA